MKVSIIIPTYNRAQSLCRALQSILNQSYTDYEVLIVDDASTDNTQALLKEFLAKLSSSEFEKIHLLTHSQNKGVSAARNTGIKKATSNWLAFLDSDDEWQPLKLSKQLQTLIDTETLINHTNETWVRDQKIIHKKAHHKKFSGRVFKQCVDMCFIGPSTSIVHRSVLDKVGLFDEDFQVCEDYDLWLRATKFYPVSYVDEELIVKHGGHDDQLSTKFHSMDFWRAKALKKHLFDESLSQEDLLHLQKTFSKKVEYLTKGCIKHKNNELLKKVLELQQKN